MFVFKEQQLQTTSSLPLSFNKNKVTRVVVSTSKCTSPRPQKKGPDRRDVINFKITSWQETQVPAFFVLIVLHLIPSFFGNNPAPFLHFFGKALLCLLFQKPPHLGRQLNVIGELGQGLCLLEKGGSSKDSKGSGEGDLYNELGVVKLLNYPSPKICLSTSSSYTNYKVFRFSWDSAPLEIGIVFITPQKIPYLFIGRRRFNVTSPSN